MNSVEEDVQGLSQAILGEARGETQQIKTDAEAKASAIRERAQKEADLERKAILDQATAEAERLRSQALATTQLKARSMELAHREELLDQIFVKVNQQLPSLPQRRDYEQIVVKLVREALGELKTDKAEIRADKATQKLLTATILDEISKDMKVQLSMGKPLEQRVGVTVEAEGGHLHFDNTFENRLSRLQGRLRASAFRVLMGESK